MRLDHYMKTSDNNIHLAAILYSLLAIGFVVIILTLLLGRSIKRDFANIELINSKRKSKRDERRRRDTSEDELGLTSSKPKAVKAEDVAWKKL